MAYSTSNPPALISSGVTSRTTPTPVDGTTALVAPKQPALWIYSSADAATVVRVTGYFTNARDLGMQKGDLVMAVDNDASPISMQLMIVSAINADGSADLSDGVAVTATNTD